MSELHEKMLGEISNDLDKSDGGFVYDTTKAVAIAVEEQKAVTTSIVDKMNVDNLTGAELHRFVYQRTGLAWKEPTFATTQILITGTPGTIVDVGTLFAADDVFFEVIERAEIGAYGTVYATVRCQQNGAIGNVPAGAINSIPVSVAGVVSVTNPEPVTNGYIGEPDEELRQRYYDKLQRPGKAGNTYHYEEWARSVVGVGKVKVYPLWNGPLTIKVDVMDINNELPSVELLNAVSERIEAERPFGAIVTVAEPQTVTIDFTLSVTHDAELTETEVQERLETTLVNYLKTLVFNAEYVSYAQTGRAILETPGISDYSNLTLNTDSSNVPIPNGYVPIVGTVTLL